MALLISRTFGKTPSSQESGARVASDVMLMRNAREAVTAETSSFVIIRKKVS
jgi:hypothetical protein